MEETAVEKLSPLRHQNLVVALREVVEQAGLAYSAIEDEQKQYTYRELLRGAIALGLAIERQTTSTRVGVMLPNVMGHLATLYALWGSGKVPVELNYTMGWASLQSACTAAQLSLIVTSRVFVAKAKLESKLAVLPVKVIYLEDIRKSFDWRDRLRILWRSWRAWRTLHQAAPADEAVVLFTSGSEGKPKGVSLSHGAILCNIAQIQARVTFDRQEKFFASLPMFHCFGLTGGVLLPLLAGAKIFFYPSPLEYKRIPKIIQQHGCTILFGTSTFLHYYGIEATPENFRGLKLVVAGAEKLATAVTQGWRDKFAIEVLEGYGVTETSPVLAVNNPLRNQPGTVGRLLSAVEWQLEKVTGVEEGGVLHVRGPNIMSGYLREEHPGIVKFPETEFGAGWYNTGDVVSFDEGGHVRIMGRLSRFAKVAGEMVPLSAVESLALRISPNAQHVAVAVASLRRGEEIVLYTTDKNLQRDQMQQEAKATGWPDFMMPRMVVWIDAMPLLGSGKVDYPAVQRLAAEQGSAGQN